jgi:hypothetical protein
LSKKANERINVGFDTTVTDYLYGNRESQQVGSLTGWWRFNFGSGSLKWNLKNIWRGSLTANYDLEADYGDFDLVYLLLLTSPRQNFTVDQTFNYKLGTLDTDLEWRWSFRSGDGLRMKFSYDCEDRELDNLLLEYLVAGGGKFTLTYDLDKPKVMLVYKLGKVLIAVL